SSRESADDGTRSLRRRAARDRGASRRRDPGPELLEDIETLATLRPLFGETEPPPATPPRTAFHVHPATLRHAFTRVGRPCTGDHPSRGTPVCAFACGG